MKEDRSDFNNYPHRVFANVVLIKGKIANWKTGDYRWTIKNFFMSHQPTNVYTNEKQVIIKSRSFIVRNREEHNKAFSERAVKFYRQFKFVKGYNLMRPY